LYLKKAADQGHARARYCYGLHLQNGVGIEPNMEEAEKYLRMSVGRATPVAHPNLPSVENQARVSVDGHGAGFLFRRDFLRYWPPISLDD
jgi:TPR repeat protein